MRVQVIAWLSLGLLSPSMLSAQAGESNVRKRAFAIRVPEGSIRVDGRLNDPAWAEATPITDFVQKEPNEGAEPAEKMVVRFVYNNGGFYVGARMYKEPGSAIQAPMGRRDRAEQAEHVLVALDTFLDRRTAYVFGVTASGVRLDRSTRGTTRKALTKDTTPSGRPGPASTRKGGPPNSGFPFHNFVSTKGMNRCGD